MEERVHVRLQGRNEVQPAIDGISNGFKKLQSDVGGINDSLKKVGNTIKTVVVAGLTVAVTKVAKFGGELDRINRQTTVTFGSMTKSVNEWARKYQSITGILASEMKMLASYGFRFGSSLGMGSDQALNLGKNVAMISQDIAALTGRGATDVNDSVIGALTGSAEMLEDYGFYVDKVTLQQELYARGINRTVDSLNDSERAIMSLNVLQRQLGDNVGYASQRMEGLDGKMKYITNSIRSIGQNIVSILTPAFNAILAVIAPVVGLIERMTAKLSALFGVKARPDETKKQTSAIVSGMGDVEKATKKASSYLASFDELVTVQKSVDVGVNDTGASGLEGSSEIKMDEWALPGDEWLDGWLASARGKIDEFLNEKRELLFGFSIADGISSLKSMWDSMVKFAKDSFKLVVEIGFNVATDLQLGAILNEVLKLGATIAETASRMFTPLANGARQMYSHIQPIVVWVGEKLRDGISFFGELATTVGDFFEENEPLIVEFCDWIGVLVETAWTIVQPFLDAAWETAQTVVSGCLDVVLGFGKWVMENKEVVTVALLGIGGAIAGIKIAKFVGGIDDMVGTLLMMSSTTQALDYLNTFSPTFAKMSGGVTKCIGGLKGLWATMMANPIGLIIGLVVGIIAGVVLLYNKCEWFRELVDGIWAWLKEFGAWIGGAFVDFFSSMWESISGVWESFKKLSVEHVQSVLDFLKKFGEFLVGVFMAKFKTWKDVALGVFDSFKTSVTEAFDGVKKVFSGVIEFVTGVFSGDWEKAWGGVKKIFSGVWDTFEAIAKAPINAIISAINVLIRGLNKIKIDVPDWLQKLPGMSKVSGSFGINLPEIPRLARGGVIDEATIAMIGEAGREVVMPLENNTGWMQELAYLLSQYMNGCGSGGSSPVNITLKSDNIITNNEALRDFARMLKPYLNDQDLNFIV